MLLRTSAVRLVFILMIASSASGQEIRPGIWAGSKVENLALPTQGYQVYLVGELHGIDET